jgi:two-component system CheB/CheR fusion protein
VSDPDFTVVGIGASAGGIDAFHAFFAHMPAANCGMALVMILHLPADRKSMLIDILSRWTSMPVVEAVSGTCIEPDHVYVPPPHTIVTIRNGVFGVELPVEGGERLTRPIDGFFDSLAAAFKERAVGIVLSGTGSDGALGLKVIKECGGLTIAQGSNGTSPQYGEMPAGAIATGAVDIIALVEEMAGHLLRLRHSTVDLSESDDPAGKIDGARLEICAILRAQLGHDFSDYRSQTFLRRVERRMQVLSIGSLEDYIAAL